MCGDKLFTTVAIIRVTALQVRPVCHRCPFWLPSAVFYSSHVSSIPTEISSNYATFLKYLFLGSSWDVIEFHSETGQIWNGRWIEEFGGRKNVYSLTHFGGKFRSSWAMLCLVGGMYSIHCYLDGHIAIYVCTASEQARDLDAWDYLINGTTQRVFRLRHSWLWPPATSAEIWIFLLTLSPMAKSWSNSLRINEKSICAQINFRIQTGTVIGGVI